jgi:putative flippase GtrA
MRALRLHRTVVRFATVGVINTLIDVVLFWALHAPLGIVVANFVSTSAGMTFSFLANGRHTFGVSRVTLRQVVLFVATNGFTMWLLQPLLIDAAYDVASAPLMLAKVVALGGSVVANFLLYRYVVWPGEPDDDVAARVRPSRRPAGLVAARGAGRR